MLLVGADPELFLRHGKKFISAHGVIPGTKSIPHSVPSGAVQVDGMALEFNIAPASSSEGFVHNINTVLEALKGMLPEEMDMVIMPSVEFDAEYLAAQPEEARVQGCEPDYNAYTMAENPAPPDHPTMRAAAGHVHVGWCTGMDPSDPVHIEVCAEMAKQMDCILGARSIFWDEDGGRRKVLYGQAGAFRSKPYGMEYRVMSNGWLLNAGRMHEVFQSTVRAWETMAQGTHWTNVIGELAVRAINNNDQEAAFEVCRNMDIRP